MNAFHFPTHGIEIEYIAGRGFTPVDLDEIAGRMRSVIGEDLAIAWSPVEHIPDTPSGKPQIIRSRVAGPDRPNP